MAGDPILAARVDALIDAFNRRSLDLPDGLFGRQTQFLLNGTPFETMLGRSPSDPLVLMLARGPAGYRFALKAVQHAVPDARLERGAVEQGADGETRVVRCGCWLSGHLRGTGEAVNDLVDVELRLAPGGSIRVASATLADDRLAVLREARLRP